MNKKLPISKHNFMLGACSMALCSGPIFTATAQEQSAETNNDLEVVRVVAQRRSEDLQDVPIAVSAFSPNDMIEKQISEPLDLVDYVPNLFGGNNTGIGSANMYYIRGLGNSESIATFDPPVGTYVDEIYIARQNANNVSFFDVEQIEVLRGPQGTLFGRNTTGGAVSVRMRKPDKYFGGYVAAEYGSFERKVLRGSVDIPISDAVLTKWSGFWLEDNGYVDAVATGEKLNGQEGYGIRADFRFLLTDDITWDLAADVTHDEGLNLLNYDRSGSPLGPLVPGGATADGGNRISNTGISTESGTGTLLQQLLSGKGLGAENNSISFTSNLAWEVDEDSQLNFIVGHRSLEQDFIVDFFDGGLNGEQYATGGFAIANAGEHDQMSAEIKYDASYLDGAVDIITGLFYFEEDNTTDFADVFTINVGTPEAIVPFPILLADRVLDNELTSKAIYAQMDWHPADDWTITLGARWTEEEKIVRYSDNRDPATVADPSLLLTTANMEASGVPTRLKESLLTPRIAVEYSYTEDVSYFLSYTEGFKSGGWNARETFPSTILPFDRELSKTTEAGLRSILFDNDLRLNATAFFTDTEDLQTPSALLRPNGSIGFLTQNFSDFKNKGIELDLTWAATDALELNVSLGLQDAEYSKLEQAIVEQMNACVASPINAGGGQGIIAPDCSIGVPVRAPDSTLSVGLLYEIDLPGATLKPSVNIRRVDETYVGTSNLPNSFEDGYTLVNVGATLNFDNSDWRITLECKNCTDEAYIVANLPPTTYYNEPRRLALKVHYEFY